MIIDSLMWAERRHKPPLQDLYLYVLDQAEAFQLALGATPTPAVAPAC